MHKLTIALLFSLVSHGLMAQNLFDEQHTLQYANYLYRQGNYQLAIPEFERLVYFNPNRQGYKLQLLETYFRVQAYEEIEASVNRWSTDEVSYPFSLYYLKVQFREGDFEEASRVLSPKSGFRFPENKLRAYQLVSYGLAGRWSDAADLCPASTDENQPASFREYCNIINEADQFREKKPWVAAGMSAVVPGLGKVYTRDYVDALVNFLFIGVTAFQAYRGFSSESISDLQGWIYGGVALSFYLGNVYGSWKAADQYNYRFYESKKESLDHTFFRYEPGFEGAGAKP